MVPVKVSLNVKEIIVLPSTERDVTGAMVALKVPFTGVDVEAYAVGASTAKKSGIPKAKVVLFQGMCMTLSSQIPDG
jgi:hypothetical protein